MKVELNPDWREFLTLLLSHRVRFLLVGGHAVAGHGEPRMTEDLDVFVLPSRPNAARLREAGEGSWTGSLETCDPGDLSADGRANALRQYNLYRWLARLPPVETSEDRNRLAQACALLQAANWRESGLSHDPPPSWRCWTQDGADGSASSNISGGEGVSRVDRYMVDGSDGPVDAGHRRWLLSNSLGPIGLGSVDGASCMQNLSGTGRADAAWTAWPPPGPFPIEAYAPDNDRNSYDEAGGSIQSEDIDLSNASVTVTAGGNPLPIVFGQLARGYGNTDAIGFVPDGWAAEVGQTYSVVVGGVDPAIAYEVTIVECSP